MGNSFRIRFGIAPTGKRVDMPPQVIQGFQMGGYRGTSLIRNSPPPQGHHIGPQA